MKELKRHSDPGSGGKPKKNAERQEKNIPFHKLSSYGHPQKIFERVTNFTSERLTNRQKFRNREKDPVHQVVQCHRPKDGRSKESGSQSAILSAPLVSDPKE